MKPTSVRLTRALEALYRFRGSTLDDVLSIVFVFAFVLIAPSFGPVGVLSAYAMGVVGFLVLPFKCALLANDITAYFDRRKQ
jgi:hypothetical protein